jgi:hypothetical protein
VGHFEEVGLRAFPGDLLFRFFSASPSTRADVAHS